MSDEAAIAFQRHNAQWGLSPHFIAYEGAPQEDWKEGLGFQLSFSSPKQGSSGCHIEFIVYFRGEGKNLTHLLRDAYAIRKLRGTVWVLLPGEDQLKMYCIEDPNNITKTEGDETIPLKISLALIIPIHSAQNAWGRELVNRMLDVGDNEEG